MELRTNWEIVAGYGSFSRKLPTACSNLPLLALSSLTGSKTTEVFTSMCAKGAKSFLNTKAYKITKQNESQIKKDGKDDDKQRCCQADAGGGHPARRGSPDGGFNRRTAVGVG